MIFSSAFFLFLFLPITYILYNICPNIKCKNFLLIIASLFFYAFGEPIYVFLMVGSILVNYFLAIFISNSSSKKRLFLILSIIFNIGLLITFKYSALLVSTTNEFTGLAIRVPEISLPIGISFYTFQILSYCIDVYRHPSSVQKNIFNLTLYIAFFPQLIAGPIVKYHDIEKQLANRITTIDDTASGIIRFIYGLSKKLLISNTMALIVDTLYTTEINMAFTAWIIAICYCLQIYFDFSGYSDMAIGLGKIFGFTFQENFNYPYIASNVQDFWRRWHISLHTWFKEYLYIPLGGNRKGSARTILNKLIVFFCTGFWHGANWTFVVWGLFHGLFLTLEYKHIIPLKNKLFSRIYALLVVIIGFVIFRADNMQQAVHIITSMFTGFAMESQEMLLLTKLLSPYNVFILILALIFSNPVACKITKHPILKYLSACGLFILCIINLATNSYNPFIYFRF